jgi:hypothetical protein
VVEQEGEPAAKRAAAVPVEAPAKPQEKEMGRGGEGESVNQLAARL